MIKSTSFAFVSAVALLAAAVSCREAAAPRPIAHEPDAPRFVVTGTQAAISGKGWFGAASPGSGADRQDFDFNVNQNLTGRVLFNEYLYSAWVKVDTTDAQTKITAFRETSALCGSDPTTGAEVDGIGRREDGQLQNFTLIACDLGPSGSGADFFKITFSTYVKQGNPPNGDIVKTVAQAPTTGNIDVTTMTSGADLPSGYSVSVDGSGTQPAGINDTVSFVDLPAGSHTVALSGVPSNCTVSGGATQPVTVTAGQTATAGYSVSCASLTGNLTVRTSTSGSSLPSGYTVAVDNDASQPIDINGSATFTGLAAGNHTVALSSVPSNCTVSGGVTTTVTVAGGQTDTTAYSVNCVTPPGNLAVTTSTTGSSLPNGYTLTVDANQSRTTGTNATTTFTALAAGSHTVVLSGVPSNCTLNGNATQTVSVPSGATATASYAVSCVTPNTTPTVSAGSDEKVLLGVLYNLRWSFADPDNGPWQYTINWGDGSTSSGMASSAGSYTKGHTYLLGSFTIRVTVTDAKGATASATKRLSVLTGGLLGL